MKSLFERLPNDMFRVIVQYLASDHIILFNSVNKKYNQLTKRIRWTHIVRNFRYVINGYQFEEANFTIEPKTVYGIPSKKYSRAILALRKYRAVTLNNTNLNRKLLRSLSYVRNIWFEDCTEQNDSMMKYFINANELISDNSNLSDIGLSYLTNITQLELTGWNGSLTDCGLKHLSKVSVLVLNQAGGLTGTGFQYLRDVKSLSLCFGHNVCDEGLQYLTNLEYLDISACNKITDNGLGYLSNVSQIILLANNLITDIGIAKLTNVTNLTIGRSNNITDKGICCLENITTLSLAFSDDITDNGLIHLSKLENLSLYCMANVTNNLFKSFPLLRKVKLDRCDQLTDEAFANMPNVKIVTLNDMYQFHDNVLDIDNFTDKAFEFMANVEYLSIILSTKITGSEFKHLKRIKELHLRRCPNILVENLHQIPSVNKLILDTTQFADVDFTQFVNINQVTRNETIEWNR